MTAPTYTFAADFTLIRDQIRQMIGDVLVTTDPLVSDEAIAFFYAQAGSSLTGGALKAAKAAAAKLALECDKTASKASSKKSQRHVAMLDTIAQLEAEKAEGNFTFTMPVSGSTADGKVADVVNYPSEFDHTDLSGPAWDASDT